MENEDAVIAAMQTSMDKKAVYVFPSMPKFEPGTTSDQRKAATEVWSQKYQRGPTGMIIYDPSGSERMMPVQMIVGFVLEILIAFLAAWFLLRSTAAASGYFARVVYCGMLGIFVSFVTHLTNWNWMGYPFDYTTAWIFDNVVGWLLAGLGIAAVVKLPKLEAA
jgi:hypothetical protein